ncbi:hypothetical protein [Streptomyces botrytidirepellens]|uniref:Uncharacterized protein n=1 Tax=Streptomyces botrytidirepellens TaxID=2486417 RepID=A0A3M8V7K1_9ACTN|nr:hypothetical protein [Streptomyces botrytidirepellens]RNG12977.1 hypothetical protein EEJ42_31905 [Streptomyces botrytidirepellens]
MFTHYSTLHQALTATGTFNGLYTALMASTPPLSVRTHADQPTGLLFFEQSPRIRNSPINGTITFNAESGAILLCANGYSGPRWYTALERLATTTAAWAWQPAHNHKPGTLEGVLQLGANVTAETCIGSSHHHGDAAADAGLALLPADRAACESAWALAVAALGVLVTDDPAYRSPVLPAPDISALTAPATDYPAAITTVAGALELLDENEDFATARDHDSNWPAEAEGAAVRALRDFQDALIHTVPASEPEPGSADRGGQTILHAHQGTNVTVHPDTP